MNPPIAAPSQMHFSVIVIGGGQAGLSASYLLCRFSTEKVIPATIVASRPCLACTFFACRGSTRGGPDGFQVSPGTRNFLSSTSKACVMTNRGETASRSISSVTTVDTVRDFFDFKPVQRAG